MTVLNLPGYSEKNKEEHQAIHNMLVANGFNTISHSWSHWQGIELQTDQEIHQILEKLPKDEVEFIIIGKSIGTRIACLISEKIGYEKIKKVIFLGFLANSSYYEIHEIYRRVLPNLNGKISIIQNINDPHGSENEVVELMNGLQYRLIRKEASDHRYLYPEDVRELLN